MNAQPPESRAAPRRRGAAVWTAAKWGIFLAVAAFVVHALVKHLAAVRWEDLRLAPPYLIASAAGLAAAMFLHAASIRMLLSPMAHPLRLRAAMSLWLSQMGKYIPGKAATIVGAVLTLRRWGVSGTAATGAVFMRAGMTIVIGLMVAAPLTLWAEVRAVLPLGWLWCGVLVAVGTILLLPKVFRACGDFFLRKFRLPPLEAMPDLRHYVAPLLTIGLHYALGGLSLWLLARALCPVPPAHLPVLISAATLANTVGFLAVFAPAGLGVREGILLAILLPLLGQGNAAVVVVASRVVQVVVEAVLALVGSACLSELPPRTPAAPD